MKNLNKFFAVSFVFAVLAPSLAFGATIKAGDDVSVVSGNDVRDNLYIAGGSVSIGSSVIGDLLAAGGNILVSKNVSEDMAVAGGSITILGNSGGDVRVAGGNITISGDVAGDLIVAGGSVTITSDVTVGKDLIVAGGQIAFDGNVLGSAQISGGVVAINGRVNGNVKSEIGEKLTIGDKAVIGGSLNYTARSAETLVKSASAVVTGKTVFTKSQVPEVLGVKNTMFAFVGALVLWRIVSVIIVALVLVSLFRRFSIDVVDGAIENPLQMLGKGFVAVVVVPVAIVILFATLFGITLGLVALALYGLLILVGGVYACVVTGAWLSKVVYKSSHITITWKNVITGAVVLTAVKMIPILGWVAWLFVVLITMGSIVDIAQKKFKSER